MGNLPNIQAIKSVVLKQVSIPNVFYNINSKNNTFTYNISGSPTSVSIAEGQYTMTTFLAAFVAATSALSMAVTLDVLTNKLQFTNSTAIEYLTDVAINPMADVLGILVDSVGDVTSFNPTGQPSLEGERNIYIDSLALGQSNLIRSNEANLNTIAVIPMISPFAAVEHYISQHSEIDDYDSQSQKSGKNLQSIDISLRDHDGEIVNLHGHHITMILKVYY